MTVTSGFSQYVENANLNWLRGTTFPAVPATAYLGLFTTAITNGVVAGSVEVPATNAYVRFAITVNTTNFVAPSGASPATSASGANFVMATPTGTGWGTVVGWGLFDAVTAGNLLHYGALASTLISAADVVEFLTGNLTLSVS
jgi:hypothetical protein